MKDIAIVMPFGKHKGERISDLPRSYLLWLSKNVQAGPWLDEAVNEALGQKYVRPKKKGSKVNLSSPWITGPDYVPATEDTVPWDEEVKSVRPKTLLGIPIPELTVEPGLEGEIEKRLSEDDIPY